MQQVGATPEAKQHFGAPVSSKRENEQPENKVKVHYEMSVDCHVPFFLCYRIVIKKRECTSIVCLCFPALSKQDLTEGSMLEPPKAATSPNSRGICTQSCNSTPSFGESTKRFGSAINRNKSVKIKQYMYQNQHIACRAHSSMPGCLCICLILFYPIYILFSLL